MRIAFRRNPKTVGWARCIAIALLIGAGVFALSLPVAFLLILSHYNQSTPNDPQNTLGALTVGMLIGVGLALVAVAGCLVVSFFGMARPVSENTPPVVS